jgi:hypothetical protein
MWQLKLLKHPLLMYFNQQPTVKHQNILVVGWMSNPRELSKTQMTEMMVIVMKALLPLDWDIYWIRPCNR